jgi:hypothetical protein
MPKNKTGESKTAKRFSVPILFIIFNRPETAERVFAEIRKLKPEKLYVSADGPRKNVRRDVILCRETREIIRKIDWECDLFTKFSKNNHGCKKGVSSAINWFFQNVEEGIILEDDCLPDQSFFFFARDLLQRYRNDERIIQICGTNPLGKWELNLQSYFFSYYGSIWGWATWRRAWEKFDVKMNLWGNSRVKKDVEKVLNSKLQYFFRKRAFDLAYNEKIDAWSYAWSFARLINSGLSVVPKVNLIQNLGFGAEAIHTKSTVNPFSSLRRMDLKFPLRHPKRIIVERNFDKKYFLKLSIYSPLYSILNAPVILLRKIFKSGD